MLSISFEEVYQHLYSSYQRARKYKSYKRDVLLFEREREERLYQLATELCTQSYQPRPYLRFISHKPVLREIFAAHFEDRIIHHLIHSFLYPYVEKGLIYDCYSCRVGKGTLFGIQRLEHHIRSATENYQHPCYILKLDISGYFMHIDKAILERKCHKLLSSIPSSPLKGLIEYLLPIIIWNNPVDNCHCYCSEEELQLLPEHKTLMHSPEGCGLPIGNLTSQLFSNLYLRDLDHYVTRTLGFRRYGRYVDDFYLLGRDKSVLMSAVPKIRDYLSEELKLQLHPHKILLYRSEQGVPFLGQYLLPFRRYLSKRNYKAIERLLHRRLICTDRKALLSAYLGLLSHTRHDSYYQQLKVYHEEG